MTWTREKKKVFKLLKLQYETAKRLNASASRMQIENIRRQCEKHKIGFEQIFI